MAERFRSRNCPSASQDLAAIKQAPAHWLWHGFVARGTITLLTSLWKSDKTTLRSLLLARRKQGGLLAGVAVQPQELARQDTVALWPEDFEKPHRSTLWKWLDHAVAATRIAREGTGGKADPFRYRLPDAGATWKKDHWNEIFEQHRQTLHRPFEPFRERQRKPAEFGVVDNG
jgi:hypothetical protein